MKHPPSRREKAMAENTNSWVREKIFLGMTPRDYIISLFTVPNLIAGAIVGLAVIVMIWRLFFGLGAATHLSDEYPSHPWHGGAPFRDEEVSSFCPAGYSFESSGIHLCRVCAYVRPWPLLSHTLSPAGFVGIYLYPLPDRLALLPLYQYLSY
jgi:hypothetical protein